MTGELDDDALDWAEAMAEAWADMAEYFDVDPAELMELEPDELDELWDEYYGDDGPGENVGDALDLDVSFTVE